jgi:hypothetical protein
MQETHICVWAVAAATTKEKKGVAQCGSAREHASFLAYLSRTLTCISQLTQTVKKTQKKKT